MPRRPVWTLYRLLYAAALLATGPFFAWRRRTHLGEVWRGRLGLDPPRSGELPGGTGGSRDQFDRPLWIHAVSVGEVGVAATLVAQLPADLPLLVTTVTPTGQERARRLLGRRAAVAYLPFDLGGPVRRFLESSRPRALVLVEGDYWPWVLAECSRRGIPIGVVNGRIGDRSFGRLRRLGGVLGVLHRRVERFAVQSELDRSRLLELGIAAERVAVTGNLKFDTATPAPSAELAAAFSSAAAGREVVVAGSTMPGEEEQLLEAFATLGERRVLLALAPRHPERFEEVGRELERRGFKVARRSRTIAPGCDVLLLDTLGELAGAYALGSIAFVGGSLVPRGGHNPIEPASHGVAITVGPSQHNFRDVAALFDRAAAWQRVADGAELARCWQTLLDGPFQRAELGQRARALVAANRGATERSLAVVAALLELA